MILYSILLGLTQNIGDIIPVKDILLQSVFGGILAGIGSGLVFRTKSSLGGTDIIAAILKLRKYSSKGYNFRYKYINSFS